MDREMLELYSDYLLASFGQTSATRLSQLLEGAVSHDQITRFLHQGLPLSKTLWRLAKPLVRQIQSPDGVLIIDDSVEAKPYSQENGTIEWHYDHSVGRVVKGLNFITAFYTLPLEVVRSGVPIGCEVIQKVPVWNEKKACIEMKSMSTKNEHYRELLRCCVQNAVVFGYVLNDSWFSGAENMNFVVLDLKKHFVMALKDNRSVTCCDEQDIVTWTGVMGDLPLSDAEVKAVYLTDIDFPVLVSRHVFKNEDGSTGVLYLCSDDPTLSYSQTLELYQKRWSVEEYHKSLKQHASFAQSPTSHPGAQVKHILCSLYAYIKLEGLRLGHGVNHFKLRSRLYLAALRASWNELQVLRQTSSQPLLPIA